MIFEVVSMVFSFQTMLFIIIGVASGMVIGCLPGLTATMGVALVLPLTFGMDAASGILLLIGVYVGAIYGGSISAVLLNVPGTPASAATTIDGYVLTCRGEGGRALGLSTVSSFIGGIVSCLMLLLISPQLAKLALRFSSPEFFMLAVFGLTIISSVSGSSLAKGLMCGFLGILCASVGIDNITGKMRFTFGIPNLLSGINFIPVLIGLFALSQVFTSIETIFEEQTPVEKIKHAFPKKSDWKIIMTHAPLFGMIGTFIGIIPGAGADIASFVAYGQVKNMSKHPELFGTGRPEGIIAPEAANNGVTGGALIPMLTLGVPGDAVAAIMIGALTMQGLQPGPLLFKDNASFVYAIFIGAFIANIWMLILGLSSIRVFNKVLTIPKGVLIPIVALLCFVGSYAMSNNFFDVAVMLVFGILGYFLKKMDYSTSPAVLGMILGPMAESHFRRALLMSSGNPLCFFSSFISVFFLFLIVVSLLIPVLKQVFFKHTTRG